MSSDDAFWLNTWEWTATIGFVLVIVGVVIEGVEHFKKFTKKDHARKLHIEKIGWLILVVGLALEFFAEHAAKRISDRDNARLNSDASEAIKKASLANERAANTESNNWVLKSNVEALKLQVIQANNNAARADLQKQPIFATEARVCCVIRPLGPSNLVESLRRVALAPSPITSDMVFSLHGARGFPNGGNVPPLLGASNSIEVFLLSSNGFSAGSNAAPILRPFPANVTVSRIDNEGDVLRLDMSFDRWQGRDGAWGRTLTPDEFVRFAVIIPVYGEILGGSAAFELDNGIVDGKRFLIPPQTTTNFNMYVIGTNVNVRPYDFDSHY